MIFWKHKQSCKFCCIVFSCNPKYQNKGYATKAITDIEKLYSNYKHWQLDTIKEEKKNVHLYQKLGYKPNGKEKIINDKMTITEFEKEINDERSN